MSKHKSVLGALTAIFAGFLLMVILAEGILRIIYPRWREFYSGHYMTLTRVPNHINLVIGRAGFSGYFAQNNGDFRVRIEINKDGLRNPEPAEAANGRIWVIGDSMAFGWGVEREEMFSSVTQRLSGQPTYNVASPGANVCGYQALAARMPKSIMPRAVVVGLVIENDLADYDCRASVAADQKVPIDEDVAPSLWQFVLPKTYLTKNSALYNFFVVSLKRVAAVDSFLKMIGLVAPEHIYHVNFDTAARERIIEKTAYALSQLRDMFPKDIPFAVLIIPARFEIRHGDVQFREIREAMVASLSKAGIQSIEVLDELRAAGFAAVHFRHDGHWSARGHEIAGAAVANWIRKAAHGPGR